MKRVPKLRAVALAPVAAVEDAVGKDSPTKIIAKPPASLASHAGSFKAPPYAIGSFPCISRRIR
jgi:hypothetical protein